MENKFLTLKNLVNSLQEDSIKFYANHNQAAGVRLRKGLQQAKILAQEARQQVTELKKPKQDDYDDNPF